MIGTNLRFNPETKKKPKNKKTKTLPKPNFSQTTNCNAAHESRDSPSKRKKEINLPSSQESPKKRKKALPIASKEKASKLTPTGGPSIKGPDIFSDTNGITSGLAFPLVKIPITPVLPQTIEAKPLPSQDTIDQLDIQEVSHQIWKNQVKTSNATVLYTWGDVAGYSSACATPNLESCIAIGFYSQSKTGLHAGLGHFMDLPFVPTRRKKMILNAWEKKCENLKFGDKPFGKLSYPSKLAAFGFFKPLMELKEYDPNAPVQFFAIGGNNESKLAINAINSFIEETQLPVTTRFFTESQNSTAIKHVLLTDDGILTISMTDTPVN